ncbi:M24 family metallopeptidase [Robertmurraya massiliosenegalensis]|uniref:M24 family metallopeptidase n=1 Tax=Robertmurraya massiliosenegalensis TaxID=1287657 RepID=UPI00031B2346|nr:Xaa-Pro peptidase family protein [Robertmurraya massiliosenegalensis]
MENNHFQERVRKLQERLRKSDITAALIMYSRDLYYYTGTAQPSNLWVPADGNPVLFTRRAHEMAKEATWIKQLIPANSFKEMLQALAELGISPQTGSTIGVQDDVLPTNIGLSVRKNLIDFKLVNVSKHIKKQRLVKEKIEVEAIKQSIELWKKGHQAILHSLRAGVTEYELSASMEYAARSNGGDGLVWFRRWDAVLPGGGIVTSGPNAWEVSGHAMTVTGVGLSETLPWGASSRNIQKGDLIVVDYGICKEGYHADMARTYCLGKPNERQKDLWNHLVELHLSVIEKVRPGVTGEELFLHAEKLAEQKGYLDHFMGVGNNRGSYIGHAIGLELDEDPVLGLGFQEPLPEGAVITLEPKFMIPGFGSVMVEDDILLTSSGHEVLGSLEHDLFYHD